MKPHKRAQKEEQDYNSQCPTDINFNELGKKQHCTKTWTTLLQLQSNEMICLRRAAPAADNAARRRRLANTT